MKQKLSIYILSLLLVLGLNSCDKSNDSPSISEKGSVKFGFSQSQSKSLLKGATVTNVTAVLVQVEGTNFSKQYKLTLNNFNGDYITEPISLEPGNYKITTFVVYNGDNVVYASPTSSSPLANLVVKPLDISFEVKSDDVVKVIPEVISTAEKTAMMFGYTTLSFTAVNTIDLLAAAFVYDAVPLNYKLVDAKLVITNGTTELYNKTIDAKTNLISVSDKYDSYTLTVTKDGYKQWSKTLTKAELQATASDPLEMILEVGTLTIVADKNNTNIANLIQGNYLNLDFHESYNIDNATWTANGGICLHRGLLYFKDLKNVKTSIKKATLVLYYYENPYYRNGGRIGNNSTKICRVIESWDNLIVTWNTQPKHTMDNAATILTNNDYTKIEVDVTTLVNDMIKYPDQSYGFLFKQTDEVNTYSAMVFATPYSGDASLNPKLVIEY